MGWIQVRCKSGLKPPPISNALSRTVALEGRRGNSQHAGREINAWHCWQCCFSHGLPAHRQCLRNCRTEAASGTWWPSGPLAPSVGCRPSWPPQMLPDTSSATRPCHPSPPMKLKWGSTTTRGKGHSALWPSSTRQKKVEPGAHPTASLSSLPLDMEGVDWVWKGFVSTSTYPLIPNPCSDL